MIDEYETNLENLEEVFEYRRPLRSHSQLFDRQSTLPSLDITEKSYKTPIVRDYYGMTRLSCDDYRMEDIGFKR